MIAAPMTLNSSRPAQLWQRHTPSPRDGMTSQRSWRHLSGNPRSARKPIAICTERQSEFFVVHSQIAVAATRHRVRHHGLHFLRHHADIGLLAAEVAEAVIAEPVGEMA